MKGKDNITKKTLETKTHTKKKNEFLKNTSNPISYKVRTNRSEVSSTHIFSLSENPVSKNLNS